MQEEYKEPFLFTWEGRPNTDLTRDELLNIIQWQSEHTEELRFNHKSHINMLEMFDKAKEIQ